MNDIHLKLIFLFVLSCLAPVLACSQPSRFEIANIYRLDGDGSWDYLTLDDATGHLFISHATMVQVLDVKTGNTIATIPDTKGVHGIALATREGKGYISDGKDSAVTIFDLRSFKTIRKLNINGANPDAILYDQFTHRVFTFNGRSNNISVIDATTDKLIGSIALRGRPEFAVSDSNGNIYLNLEDKNEIAHIDSKALKVIGYWSITPGDEPSGLALDVRNNILFSVCSNNKMMIVDATTRKIVSSVPIGSHPDAVAFDPSFMQAYSSNGDGTITVVKEVSPTEFKVTSSVQTRAGAKTIALSNLTHHLYLPTAEFLPRTSEKGHPPIKPGTFMILDVAPVQ